MNGLPRYYTVLFNAVEEALAALERQDFGTARTLLLQGQLRAEGEYAALAEEEDGDRERAGPGGPAPAGAVGTAPFFQPRRSCRPGGAGRGVVWERSVRADGERRRDLRHFSLESSGIAAEFSLDRPEKAARPIFLLRFGERICIISPQDRRRSPDVDNERSERHSGP